MWGKRTSFFLPFVRHGDARGNSYEQSWAHGHGPECERCSTAVTWGGFHPDTTNLQSQTLHILYAEGWKSLQLSQESVAPSPTIITNSVQENVIRTFSPPPPRIHTQIVETVLGIFQMQMQRRDKGFLANCLSCKSTEGERRNHRGDWGYGCFKAKQLIVIFLRSGVSTFTLQLDFKMLPPPSNSMHRGVCKCICQLVRLLCETVFCVCEYDHQSVLETVSSYLS